MNEQKVTKTGKISPVSNDVLTTVRKLWNAIKAFEESFDNLSNENSELKNRSLEVENIWKKYHDLKNQIPTLKEKASISDNLIQENTKLKTEVSDIKSKFSELEESQKNCDSVKQDNINKNKLLNEKVTEIQKLNDTISELKSDINKQNKDIDELLENDLKAQHQEEINKLNEKYATEIKQLKSQKSELESKNSYLLETISSKEAELIESNKQLHNSKQESDNNQELQKHKEILINELEEKEELVSQKSAEIKRQNALIINLESDLKDFREKNNDFEKKFRKIEDEKFELKAKVQELLAFKMENSDKIKGHTELTDKISELIIKNKKFETELSGKSDLLNTVRKELTETKLNLEEADKNMAQNKKMEMMYKIQAEELKMLQAGDKELKGHFENLMTELNRLKDEYRENENIMQDYSKEKVGLYEKIESLNLDIIRKNEIITNLEEKLQNIPETKNSINFDNKDEIINGLDKFINQLEIIVEPEK